MFPFKPVVIPCIVSWCHRNECPAFDHQYSVYSWHRSLSELRCPYVCDWLRMRKFQNRRLVRIYYGDAFAIRLHCCKLIWHNNYIAKVLQHVLDALQTCCQSFAMCCKYVCNALYSQSSHSKKKISCTSVLWETFTLILVRIFIFVPKIAE